MKKTTIRASMRLHFPLALKNPDGTCDTQDVILKIKEAGSKKKAVKMIRRFCWYYSIDFKEFCALQNIKFILEWQRRNYVYL